MQSGFDAIQQKQMVLKFIKKHDATVDGNLRVAVVGRIAGNQSAVTFDLVQIKVSFKRVVQINDLDEMAPA